MNYTKSNDPDHQDSPNDWLASSLIFARALGLSIPNGQAVLIRPVGDISKYIELNDNNDLLVVANLENQIKIFYLSDYVDNVSDFEEGMMINVTEG